jgi:2-oxoglutarate dehydrogenase E2 component (dihydrolipoamide succinyltransferase)
MPQLGETVTEGTITRWAKQVGDQIAEDEVLFEVSTDKVDSEVPSPVAGVVAEILVAEGETVDVGTRLAVISDGLAVPSGEAAPSVESAEEVQAAEWAAASEPESPGEVTPGEVTPGEVTPGEVTPGEVTPAVHEASPQPRSQGATTGVAEQAQADTADSPSMSGQAGETSGNAGLVLSPVVRRLIAEHSLDPSTITGSGAGGRITRSDVLAVIDSLSAGGPTGPTKPPARIPGPSAAVPARAAVPASAAVAAGSADAANAPRVPAAQSAPAVVGPRDEVVPFTNIRRRTAEHMIRSKHTSAHTMVAVEVDYLAVERVRRAEKERFRAAEGFSLTYLPFVTRAVVDALEDFPNVNSSVGDDALIVHHDLNIGVAVDLDFEGLLVPVVHSAEAKRLRTIAREISELAARARARRLTMDDISGGTFTITNAGPFGTLMTVPLINQPQVAILSTDGVRKKPVAVELVDGSDGIAVHPVGNLVLSWDHRAFDGAYAAAFLKSVKDTLETRDWSAEL